MTGRRADWDTAGRAVISAGLLYGALSLAGAVAVAVAAPPAVTLLLEAAAFVVAFVVVVVAVIWVGELRRLAAARGHDRGRVTHGGLSLWAVTLLLSVLLVLAGLLVDDPVDPVLLTTRTALRCVGAIALVAGVRVTRSRVRRMLAGTPLPPTGPPAAEPTAADWDAGTLDPAARRALERKRRIYYD